MLGASDPFYKIIIIKTTAVPQQPCPLIFVVSQFTIKGILHRLLCKIVIPANVIEIRLENWKKKLSLQNWLCVQELKTSCSVTLQDLVHFTLSSIIQPGRSLCMQDYLYKHEDKFGKYINQWTFCSIDFLKSIDL